MEIKSSYKIGAHTVKVVFSDYDEALGGSDNYAQYDALSLVITIRDSLPQTRKESAFLHELFEMCNALLGGFHDHESYAQFMEFFFAVLKENKVCFD